MPWQIGKRLGRPRDNGGLVKVSRGTVTAIMKTLSSRGIARNHGTRESPLWVHATVQNATLKKTTRKKATLLRTTSPVRQISPAQHELSNHKGASPGPFGKRAGRTDLAAGNAAALTAAAAPPESAEGSATHVPGERLPFSDSTLRECHLLDLDLEALIDRYFEVEGKKAAKGKRIADPNAYLLKMARDERAKANGVKVDDLKDIASPNKWARGTALAKAMGAPTTSLRVSRLCWPGDAELKRIDAQLERDGFVPAEMKQKWADAYLNRMTRLDYRQSPNVSTQGTRGRHGGPRHDAPEINQDPWRHQLAPLRARPARNHRDTQQGQPRCCPTRLRAAEVRQATAARGREVSHAEIQGQAASPARPHVGQSQGASHRAR